MKVAFLALGSRGDTEPCVALGARLLERGHQVDVLAPRRYGDTITRVGLTHRPLAVDPADVMASPEGQALLSSGPLGFVRGIRAVAAPLAEQLLRDAADACRDADVVLAPPIGGLGRHMADAFGVARVLLHFQPSEPTRQFPNPLLGPRRLGPWLNRASYVGAEAATELVLHSMINRARRQVLALPPLTRGATHLDRREGVPVLCAVSPAVQPRPDDWPENVHLTGGWTVPERPLPAETRDFLAAGPPPVYVGFGSMVPERPAELGASVVAAARESGLRAIVQGLPVAVEPDVHVVHDVDHAALFAHTAAVVHHGGAGTTAAGLRAGVPSLVCPFFGDQPYWAGRVADLAVGPQPLHQKELTVGRLSQAMRQSQQDQLMRERAAELGRRLAAEDGAGRAAEVVERILATV